MKRPARPASHDPCAAYLPYWSQDQPATARVVLCHDEINRPSWWPSTARSSCFKRYCLHTGETSVLEPTALDWCHRQCVSSQGPKPPRPHARVRTRFRPSIRGFGVEPPEMPEPVAALPYQHAITCGITGIPYPDYINDGKDKAMCFGPQWMFDEVMDEQKSDGMLMGALIGGGVGLVIGGVVGLLMGGTP